MDLDFVGIDPDSQNERCPTVLIDPATGDFYFQGKTVSDPAIIAMIAEHGVIATDETIVWLPARMIEIIREAIEGYERGQHGPGHLDFTELLGNTKRSAVHLELRDAYGPRDPEFLAWLEGRHDGGQDAADRWTALIFGATERGVKVRRARVVSEPVSEYTRFLYEVTDRNIAAGEEVRWLPRRQAAGLMLPHTDLWMFDQRLVRFNHTGGDGTDLAEADEYTTDPRAVTQIVGAFEMVWERATPHADYKP